MPTTPALPGGVLAALQGILWSDAGPGVAAIVDDILDTVPVRKMLVSLCASLTIRTHSNAALSQLDDDPAVCTHTGTGHCPKARFQRCSPMSDVVLPLNAGCVCIHLWHLPTAQVDGCDYLDEVSALGDVGVPSILDDTERANGCYAFSFQVRM